jgi:mono/diheme cytochrome c family protein
MFRNSFVGMAAVVLLTGSVAWAVDGATVFKDRCAKCHGAEGKSDTSVAKTLKIPALAGDAEVAAMSEPDIVAKIKGVEKHKSTTAKMSDDDLNAVAAFVKKLAGGK